MVEPWTILVLRKTSRYEAQSSFQRCQALTAQDLVLEVLMEERLSR